MSTELSVPPSTVGDMRQPSSNEVWSPSRVRKYLQCPRAWWLAYRSGVEGRRAPTHWRRGNVAHAALEAAYRVVCELEDPITDPRLTMETFFPVADRALGAAWTEYEMPADQAAQDDLREQVRLVLASQPVPHPESILGVELDLRARIAHPLGAVSLRGLIDLAFRLAPNRVHVRDWKTYSRVPDPEELRQDIQLRVYALLLMLWYDMPEVQVSASIYSVPRRFEQTVRFERAELEEVGLAVADVVHAALADEVCEPRPSEWCDTCSHKAFCPIFNPTVSLGPGSDPQRLAVLRGAVQELDGF